MGVASFRCSALAASVRGGKVGWCSMGGSSGTSYELRKTRDGDRGVLWSYV